MKILHEHEATALLRLPKGTLASLRSRGEAPPNTKVGSQVIYLQEDLEAWVSQRTKASAQQGAPDREEVGGE